MKKYFLLLIIGFFALRPMIVSGESSEADVELWNYLQRQSKLSWDIETKKGVVDRADWSLPIETAFVRLARASGQPRFKIQYAVLSDNINFNASAYPGGQFIITNKVLMDLDEFINKETSGKVLDATALSFFREQLIAPIIAHELSHYYNRHMFQILKKHGNLSGEKPETITLSIIKYTQTNELDADCTGYLLLQRAGYNPDLMISMLEMNNAKAQEDIKLKRGINTYISSHPSWHERLAAFKSNRTEWHQWAASMDKAFSDIQLGSNLDKAISVVKTAIEKFPDNIHFYKAYAVGLHKKWLVTVPLSSQRLRGIIDMPSFYDEMVFSDRRTKGAGGIPGNRAYYEAAREAYEYIYMVAHDHPFYSNYALLLSYSPDRVDKDKAWRLAASSHANMKSIQTFNNLAVVLYNDNNKDEAIGILKNLYAMCSSNQDYLIEQVNMKNEKIKAALVEFYDLLRKSQVIDRQYVTADHTPVLNLALALSYENQKDEAKKTAEEYLTKYEAGSSWAEYVAVRTGIPKPETQKKEYIAVNGIKVGTPVATVLSKWGKPSQISNEQNYEVWDYNDFRIKLYIASNEVLQLAIVGAPSPVVNKFGIGSKRNDIEKIIGSHSLVKNSYFLYNKNNIAVEYVQDVAVTIVLFR